MPNDEPARRLLQLARNAAEDVANSYRIDQESAAQRIFDIWSRDTSLKSALALEPCDRRLVRTRTFKQAVTAARRTIYYELRRYMQHGSDFAETAQQLSMVAPRAEPQRIAQLTRSAASAHASIAERLGHLDEFFSALVAAIGPAESVIDIGGGALPLIFPFDRIPTLRRYLLLERDAAIVAAVAAYGRWRGDDTIRAATWDIGDGWTAAAITEAGSIFDVALMLKLIPVIGRQFPRLLPTLGGAPARRLVVSGSKQALVKRRSIAGRELRLISKFASDFELQEVGRFETPDEVGLALEKRRMKHARTVACKKPEGLLESERGLPDFRESAVVRAR